MGHRAKREKLKTRRSWSAVRSSMFWVGQTSASFLPASGPHLLKEHKILFILMPPHSPLVPYQLIKPDVVYRHLGCMRNKVFFDFVQPGLMKTDAFNFIDQIHSVWRYAKLKNHSVLHQLFLICYSRYVARPKIIKGRI